jgi:hypothetical protein
MHREPFQPSRRHWLQSASAGFGYLAFAGLSTMRARAESTEETPAAENPLAPKRPHFPARAKRVIFLCMQGGPSHVDTFDYKPELMRSRGKRGKRNRTLLAPQWKFKQRGQSGLWISDLFPAVARHADKLCLIRSMHCDQPVHPRALTQMHTGNPQFVRPSLGAWSLYGLGTENQSMPGFIAMNTPGAQNIGSAFLPAVYQGTPIGGRGGRRLARLRRGNQSEPAFPDLKNDRLSARAQRRQLDFIQQLNQSTLRQDQQHAGIEGAIESFELAFRMQDTMPELMDLSDESQATLDLYGIEDGPDSNFARQCLLARRFAESGVRFVEITHRNWDHHAQLSDQLPRRAAEVDRPIAALLADLEQRGLLEETLVMWGGEFGRTPDGQNGNGRDHNNKGYTLWMAGGGVRGGISYGATDELGYEAVENPCHIHDWHATVLHLLGLDHTKLTYRYAGRDFRLTDVYGNVVEEIIA